MKTGAASCRARGRGVCWKERGSRLSRRDFDPTNCVARSVSVRDVGDLVLVAPPSRTQAETLGVTDREAKCDDTSRRRERKKVRQADVRGHELQESRREHATRKRNDTHRAKRGERRDVTRAPALDAKGSEVTWGSHDAVGKGTRERSTRAHGLTGSRPGTKHTGRARCARRGSRGTEAHAVITDCRHSSERRP